MSSENEDEIKRNRKGQFRKGTSGNKRGRPVGSKGKSSAETLEKIWAKNGPEAIEVAMTILRKSAQLDKTGKMKDTNNAAKMAMWVGGKYMEWTMSQQRLEMSAKKAAPKEGEIEEPEDMEEDDTPEFRVVFSKTAEG